MNTTHVSTSGLIGAILGGGLALLVLLPGKFSPGPESVWNPEMTVQQEAVRLGKFGFDPFADFELAKDERARAKAIARGHAFIDHHPNFPGSDVLVPALVAHAELLEERDREILATHEERMQELEKNSDFFDYTERILNFQTEKLADLWRKFAHAEPEEFVHKWVYNELSAAFRYSRDLEYWKRVGAID